MADSAAQLSMLDSVLGALHVGAVVLDPARQIVLWNRWMARHAGLPAASVLGRDLLAVFPELEGKRLQAAIRQALADNFPSVLSQTLHKAPFPLFANEAARVADTRMQQAVAVTPIAVAGAARHCLIQIADVSVAVHREQLLRDQALELRSQSYSDGLTGIANRRHFDMAIEKEVRRAKRSATPLSLMMIDIDSFKAYNDHYGHQQGDDTLINVACTLSAMLQRPHDLIARYGGEEFAVILPELGAIEAAHMAEALRRTIVELNIDHAWAVGCQHVTVSIGLATQSADNPVEVPAVLGAADRALYIAKRNGRNQVVVQNP
jgi:diguanylate cyclase (GGDEF)-like protein